MAGGGGDTPPPGDGGEFLLQLLKKPPHYHFRHHPPQPQLPAQRPPGTQILTHDPAVAAVGPTVPVPFHQLFPSNGLAPRPTWPHQQQQQQQQQQQSPPFAPHNYYLQNPNPNPNPRPNPNPIFQSASPPGFSQGNFQQSNPQLNYNSSGDAVGELGFLGTDANASSAHQQNPKDLIFGSFSRFNEKLVNGNSRENLLVSQEEQGKLGTSPFKEKRKEVNGYWLDSQRSSVDQDPRATSSGLRRGHGQERSDSSRRGTGYWGRQGHNFNNHRAAGPPPGFTGQQMSGESREYTNGEEIFEHFGEKGRNNFGEARYRRGKNELERRYSSRNGRNDGDCSVDRGLSIQLHRPGPPSGSKLHSVPASDVEDSMMAFHCEDGETGKEFGNGTRDRAKEDGHRVHSDLDDLEEQLVDSLGLEDESDEKSDKKKHHGSRDKVIPRHIYFHHSCVCVAMKWLCI